MNIFIQMILAASIVNLVNASLLIFAATQNIRTARLLTEIANARRNAKADSEAAK